MINYKKSFLHADIDWYTQYVLQETVIRNTSYFFEKNKKQKTSALEYLRNMFLMDTSHKRWPKKH